jgi:hypothetical protein
MVMDYWLWGMSYALCGMDYESFKLLFFALWVMSDSYGKFLVFAYGKG